MATLYLPLGRNIVLGELSSNRTPNSLILILHFKEVLINNFYINMESKLFALVWCQILVNSLFLCGATSSTMRPYRFRYLQNICIFKRCFQHDKICFSNLFQGRDGFCCIVSICPNKRFLFNAKIIIKKLLLEGINFPSIP